MNEFAFSIHTLPPSANNLFYTSARDLRRHRVRAYSDWMETASRSFWFARGLQLEAPYAVEIQGVIPANRDPDNLYKPVIDLLVHNRIISDDKAVGHTEMDRICAELPAEAAYLGQLHVRVWEWRPDRGLMLGQWLEKMKRAQPK